MCVNVAGGSWGREEPAECGPLEEEEDDEWEVAAKRSLKTHAKKAYEKGIPEVMWIHFTLKRLKK